MDPFTIASLIGTGVNVVGKLMGGSSSAAMDRAQSQAYLTQAEGYDTQAKVYDTKASIDNLNTGILNEQADVAGMGVDFAASKERDTLGKIAEAGRQTLSAQRTYFAGNNLDPTFGSPLLAQAMTAGRIATDMDLAKTSFAIDKANALSNEATIRGQAAGSVGQGLSDMLSASATRLSASAARASAGMALQKADADTQAGYFGAATALLSGVGGLKGYSFSMPTFNLTSAGFNPIAGVSGK
jgi:hypothetical protein